MEVRTDEGVSAEEFDRQELADFERGFAGEDESHEAAPEGETPEEEPAGDPPAGDVSADDAQGSDADDSTGDSPTADGQTDDAGELEASDPIAELRAEYEAKFRDVYGRFGGMNRQILDLTSAETTATGADAPTSEQIQAAAQNSDKFDALKKDFPEWGEALEEQIALVKGQLTEEFSQSSPPVDVDQIRSDLATEIRAEVHVELEKNRVEFSHPGWENTLQTDEFQTWLYRDGPTPEQQSELRTLETSAAPEAADYLNDLIRQYPQWWSDRGSLVSSPKSVDAIALFDRYAASTAETADPEGDDPSPDALPAVRRQRSNKRLESAAAPTTGTRARPPQRTSEEQEFEAGFYGR